jgi:hypothetical protein
MGQTWGSLVNSYTPAEGITLLLFVVLLVLVGLIGWRKWQDFRFDPAAAERQRRKALSAHGKMGDATVVEIRDSLIFYSYDVRGIEYIASQDVAGLDLDIPLDPDATGPVLVKYDPRNPANSMIASEEWSGIRKTGVGG